MALRGLGDANPRVAHGLETVENELGPTTTLLVGDATVRFAHFAGASVSSAEPGGAVLVSNESNDTLTKVSVELPDLESTIHVLWNRASDGEFGVLLARDTGHIFVGGGQIAAVLDLRSGAFVFEDHPLLFWSFERAGPYVVQYGEVECVLLDSQGKSLDRADVDPPYEVVKSRECILFDSIVTGRTGLRFPKAIA